MLLGRGTDDDGYGFAALQVGEGSKEVGRVREEESGKHGVYGGEGMAGKEQVAGEGAKGVGSGRKRKLQRAMIVRAKGPFTAEVGLGQALHIKT